VSKPGKLQCKKLVHAVGPIWSGEGTQKENCLREAIHESLLAAERLGLASIAFPALSAGIRNFPIDVCTEIIATTVADYIGDHTETCVKTVSLVHPDDQGVAAFCKSFDPFKVQGKLLHSLDVQFLCFHLTPYSLTDLLNRAQPIEISCNQAATLQLIFQSNPTCHSLLFQLWEISVFQCGTRFPERSYNRAVC